MTAERRRPATADKASGEGDSDGGATAPASEHPDLPAPPTAGRDRKEPPSAPSEERNPATPGSGLPSPGL